MSYHYILCPKPVPAPQQQSWTLHQLHRLCVLRRGPSDVWAQFLASQMAEKGCETIIPEEDRQLAYMRWCLG